jgi:hypothetical protein
MVNQKAGVHKKFVFCESSITTKTSVLHEHMNKTSPIKQIRFLSVTQRKHCGPGLRTVYHEKSQSSGATLGITSCATSRSITVEPDHKARFQQVATASKFEDEAP